MTRHLHFDLVSGIAGDMAVAALLDAGVPTEVVEDALDAIDIDGYSIEHGRADVGMATTARRFHVLVEGESADHDHHHEHDHDHHHEHDHGHEHGHHHEHRHDHVHQDSDRSWHKIRELITGSSLDPAVVDVAVRVFSAIAEAEARVHGMEVEDVVFHEVGAVDSIVDIVAFAAAFASLRPTRVTASPVPLGRGFTMSQHGRIPVPAPATLLLLEGVPVVETGLEKELVTPTGAGILQAVVEEYVQIPSMTIERVGHGGGTRRLPDRPNLVRALVGSSSSPASLERSVDVIIEANIDDMSPEVAAHATTMLLEAGALDVWLTPIVMKKGRPGQCLSVLSPLRLRDKLIELVLAETTSIGVRTTTTERFKAWRRTATVETPWGPVTVKIAWDRRGVTNVAPELESARRLASEAGVPLKRVMTAAAVAAATLYEESPQQSDA